MRRSFALSDASASRLRPGLNRFLAQAPSKQRVAFDPVEQLGHVLSLAHVYELIPAG